MISEIEKLASGIKDFSDQNSILIVGVSGLGGAGKSTLCHDLVESFPDQAIHFECDLFAQYGTLERRQRISEALDSGDEDRIESEENPQNWYDWQRIEQALISLKETGRYNFTGGFNQKSGEKDKAAELELKQSEHAIIFVDCIYLLHLPVRDLIDCAIYIDAPLEESFQRSYDRDKHRSDHDYLVYKQNVTKKYCVPYFDKYRQYADIIFKPKNH